MSRITASVVSLPGTGRVVSVICAIDSRRHNWRQQKETGFQTYGEMLFIDIYIQGELLVHKERELPCRRPSMEL